MFVSVPTSTLDARRCAASTSRTRSIWRRSSSGVDVVAEAVRGRVVGDRDVLVGRARARRAPSPRSCCARRRRSCACAGRRAGRPASTSAGDVAVAQRELAAVLAQLGRDPRQAEQRVDLLLGRAAVRLAGRRRRGSRTRETCSPRRTAASRSATLCALEPVKCCSRLPNWSGSTTRRSIGRPVCVRAAGGVVARRRGRLDEVELAEARRAARGGSVAVAMMSRSLTESAMRRAEPASSTRSAAGMRAQRLDDRRRRRCSARCSSIALRAASRRRRPRSAASTDSSNFGPKPAHVAQALRSRPPRAARRASRCPARRRACARAWARARAGASCRAGRAGTSPRSFSAAGIVPVSSSATSFSSSVLPMPGQRRDRALARRARRPSAAPRAPPWPRCGRRARGARPRRRARRGRRARRRARRSWRSGGRARHRRRGRARVRAPMPGPPGSSCRPTTRPRTSRRSCAPRRPCSRAAAPGGYRILVVDDDSPDGTGAIADRLAAEHAEVEVLHRPRREGLGPAYLAGFARALARGAGARPRDGRRLLARPGRPRAAARRGARRAPTSRSARATSPAAASPTGAACGGSSAAAARGTRAACSALGVRDLTGGFKCFRREVLEAIDLPTVRSHGYAFQVELTYRALCAGLSRRRGADRLPRPPARALEDVVADRGRGDVARARSCAERGALRPRPRRARLKPRPPRAEATRDEVRASSRSSRACATRAPRSRAGTPAPWRVVGRWLARLAARSPSRCCSRVWVVARSSTPDATPLLLPGPQRARPAWTTSRTSSAATRSCSRCTRWPAWPASSPAARCRCEAERYTRRVALDPRPRRPAGDRLRRRARRVLAGHAGLRARQRARRRSPRSSTSRPACCCSRLLPHALPELVALFLPLAAWIVASRRGDWHELLAATFVTSLLAVPVARRSRRSSRSTSARTCCGRLAGRLSRASGARRNGALHFV